MNDDWKNFEPRKNAPKPEFPGNAVVDKKPKIDINDQEALKALATEVLVEIIQNSPRNVSLVAACREILDRAVGKAPQSIAMTVKQDNASKLSDDQLAALLAMLPSPIVIPPMPKRLEDNS